MNMSCWSNPWTEEDIRILHAPLYLIGEDSRDSSPAERDASLMRHLARESLFQRTEREICLEDEDRRLVCVHIANRNEPNPGPYEPPCWKGDLLVTFRGYGLGSRSWTENLGAWRPLQKGL